MNWLELSIKNKNEPYKIAFISTTINASETKRLGINNWRKSDWLADCGPPDSLIIGQWDGGLNPHILINVIDWDVEIYINPNNTFISYR